MSASPTASSKHLPRDTPNDRPFRETNGNEVGLAEKGESLPMSAQTPHEIERSLSHPEKREHAEDSEKTGESGFFPPRQERLDSFVPEGKGSKRLYQLSKRFSTCPSRIGAEHLLMWI